MKSTALVVTESLVVNREDIEWTANSAFIKYRYACGDGWGGDRICLYNIYIYGEISYFRIWLLRIFASGRSEVSIGADFQVT